MRSKVAVAHMELAQPSIADAIAELASQGETDVVVVPYFLSPGRHITQDIPALVASAQEANPGVRCSIAGPIGALLASACPEHAETQPSAHTGLCRHPSQHGKHYRGQSPAGA